MEGTKPLVLRGAREPGVRAGRGKREPFDPGTHIEKADAAGKEGAEAAVGIVERDHARRHKGTNSGFP